MFGKKVKPDELRTRINVASSKLEGYERKLMGKEQEARTSAKQALRAGDERGFRQSSRRVALLQGQRTAVSGMVDMAAGMRDIIEMQSGLKEIVSIGNDLKQFEKHLGIDHSQIEKALTQVAMSTEKVNVATSVITDTIESVALGNGDLSASQEALRKELLAELQGDHARTDDLERRLKTAQSASA